jgi:arsenate reductase
MRSWCISPRIAAAAPTHARLPSAHLRKPYADAKGDRMSFQPYNVLFLCTGNSARSIMAEAILNRLAADKFRAYSAGSQPKGQPHPEAIRLLQSLDYDTSKFRSKSWNEFARPGAPALDFVFTVCDNAAGEACPFWPGQPMTAHWGIPDPAEATGTPAQVALAFKDAYRMLRQRIAIFAALPIRSLDQLSLQTRLQEIGRMSTMAKEPN